MLAQEVPKAPGTCCSSPTWPCQHLTGLLIRTGREGPLLSWGVMGSPSLEAFRESLGNPTSACSEGTPLVGPALASPPVLAVLTLTSPQLPCGDLELPGVGTASPG